MQDGQENSTMRLLLVVRRVWADSATVAEKEMRDLIEIEMSEGTRKVEAGSIAVVPLDFKGGADKKHCYFHHFSSKTRPEY